MLCMKIFCSLLSIGEAFRLTISFGLPKPKDSGRIEVLEAIRTELKTIVKVDLDHSQDDHEMTAIKYITL